MTLWAAIVLLGVAVAPPAAAHPMLVNSGACLEPIADVKDGLHGESRMWPTPVVATDPGVIAEVLMAPSFDPPQLLSLHRRRRGDYFGAVTTGGVVTRRDLDSDTARLMANLLEGLVGRAQVVTEVGTMTDWLDGVGYYFWYQGAAGSVHGAEIGTVLAEASLAAERLAYLVTHPTPGEPELPNIRALMRDALERTKGREACLTPIHGDDG